MKSRISFYALVKDFNSGALVKIDVMNYLYDKIYDKKGKLSKVFHLYDNKYNVLPICNKERLDEFVRSYLRYMYWSKCEYEFVIIDWPYKCENENGNLIDIEKNRAAKIDVYQQIEPNIPLIVDLLWEEIKELI